MIDRRFGKDSYSAYTIDQVIQLRHVVPSGNDVAISGHAAWGVHEYLENRFYSHYYTFLRHPWDLFLSSYRYERAIYKHIGDIVTYFRRYRHNFLIDYLGNGDAALAHDRLFEYFSCYGLKEDFQTSLIHIRDQLGIHLGREARLKVGEPKALELPDWLAPHFNELNRYDIEFYQTAVAIFRKRTAHLQCEREIAQATASADLEKEPMSFAGMERSIPESADEDMPRYVMECLKGEQDQNWYAQARIRLKLMGYQVLSDQVLMAGFRRYPVLLAFNEAVRLRRTEPQRAAEILQWYLELLREYSTDVHDSFINKMISRANALLAGVYEDMGRAAEAEAIYRACAVGSTEGLDHLRRLIVLMRKTNRHEECRDLIIAYGTVASDSLRSMINKELALAYYDAGEIEAAYDLINKADNEVCNHQIEARQIVPVHNLPKNKGIVIFNTAPRIVYDVVMQELLAEGVEVTLVTAPHALERLRLKLHHRVVLMPDGFFDYANDAARLDPSVFRLDPDAVLILMSRYAPEDYTEIIRLAEDIHHAAIYCYAMEFIFSARLKRSVVKIAE